MSIGFVNPILALPKYPPQKISMAEKREGYMKFMILPKKKKIRDSRTAKSVR
jgi:hypothetical protein